MKQEEVQKTVRERYGKIAKKTVSGGCGCRSAEVRSLKISLAAAGTRRMRLGEISKQVGYTEAEINAVPEGANLGLGCGNPIALASLEKGRGRAGPGFRRRI